MTAPQVTVVIPTYNRSWGLRRAVLSVLAQTYPCFELIIMDDCSTDDTAALAKSFADPRVRYLRQAQNVGVARNWGEGLRHARTPYVGFLMDDDYYDPDYLQNRVSLLEEHPRALVAFSGYKRVRADGSFLALSHPACQHGHAYAGPKLLDIFLTEGGVFVGAMLYRREAIAALWDEVERFDLVVDLALNIRLAMLPGSCGVYCGKFDFNMCIHEGQMYQVGNERVYQQTEKVLLDQLARAKGDQARFFRRNYIDFLTGWANAAVGRSRWVAFHRLVQSILWGPLSWDLWWRRIYILSLILGLKQGPGCR
jgi:glycosyltransferase involved in cell wall biosynthesis